MTSAKSSDRPELAELLDLSPHPEGGWYRETWRTALTADPSGYDGSRALASGIYFLLNPGEESRWHVVGSDEVWLWHRGGPLTMRLAGSGAVPGDRVETHVLGADIEAGQRPQVLVPAGVWQAAEPAGGEPVLVSAIVAPGFDFRDFRLA